MEGFRLFKSLKLKNFLSFGDPGVELELEPLNVLIGPNGCGKSNFIEGIRVLAATPSGVTKPLRDGAPTELWEWQGPSANGAPILQAEIHDPFCPPHCEPNVFRHTLELGVGSRGAFVLSEQLAVRGTSLPAEAELLSWSHARGAEVLVSPVSGDGLHRGAARQTDLIEDSRLIADQSLLEQLRDPHRYAELAVVVSAYGRVQVHGNWHVGRGTPARKPQLADEPALMLAEDASNLPLVISELRQDLDSKRRFLAALQRFLPDVEDLDLLTRGGTIQITVQVHGLSKPLPAARLSDGTLRFLCLLAVLLDPDDGRLICLEEPELGLHPDAIALLAELLVEASQRNQFVITTHSDALVAALSHVPEAVVVCERGEKGTTMRRLSSEELGDWLDEYTLADLWSSGKIGGNP